MTMRESWGALLNYSGFADYGLRILAAFDISVTKPQQSNMGLPIYGIDALAAFCRKNNVGIDVITVLAACTQSVGERLVASGVHAIWCFAPVALSLAP